ncbi:hypothetical protein P4O66_002658 [Electrophorus voltai]|uniref:Rhodanese domain-containing protein n=1 Tax=Electrophorus voltai TaxID=2609070 RepID=A0AAD9DMW2_9TELE|nr:hypothetical protein P4O66_002658 [Electrophorus voltai]
MDIKRLAGLLQRGAGRLLVIDSRTFSEYNASHVHGAVNVCCSKLVKRRLQQDKVSVIELLQPNGKVKVMVRSDGQGEAETAAWLRLDFVLTLRIAECYVTSMRLMSAKVDLTRRQEVVVYDQSTKDVSQLSKEGFVHILLSKLDGTFHKVSLLTAALSVYSVSLHIRDGPPRVSPAAFRVSD